MNIVITGASSGLGYQAALKLAEDRVHSVFAVSRNKEKLLQLKSEALKLNPHSSIHIIIGDISDEKFTAQLATEISIVQSGVDVLINNAGMLINKPFQEINYSDWEKLYSTNVFGTVNIIRSLLPLLEKGKSANEKSHILNISSMGGFQGSIKFKGLSAYSSSKAALVGITECLAVELKDRFIAVNCLCLGSVQTEMFSAAFPGFKASSSAEEMASFVARFALEGQKLFNGKIIPVADSTP